MPKPVIFSGIQPTGNLHLGNYLGAIRNWVELQNSGDYTCFFSIVDYHSLTGDISAEERREQIIRTAAELIAAGIDPKKSTLFVQSHVPEHTELAWVFSCLTPIGELKRMTQFKDKTGFDDCLNKSNKLISENYKKWNSRAKEAVKSQVRRNLTKMENNAKAGLFMYPVLQAADILLYHGTHVPVGEDQIQHVELTRDIARWFNKRYGEYFPETKVILTKTPRVKSLLEPSLKMSKSKGAGHVIELADEPELISKKMKKAVTATEGGGRAPGVENLFVLLKEFAPEEIYKQFIQEEKNTSIQYGSLKEELGRYIAEHFAEFRERRRELLDTHNELAEILAGGAAKARDVAGETMGRVREMIGVR